MLPCLQVFPNAILLIFRLRFVSIPKIGKGKKVRFFLKFQMQKFLISQKVWTPFLLLLTFPFIGEFIFPTLSFKSWWRDLPWPLRQQQVPFVSKSFFVAFALISDAWKKEIAFNELRLSKIFPSELFRNSILKSLKSKYCKIAKITSYIANILRHVRNYIWVAKFSGQFIS